MTIFFVTLSVLIITGGGTFLSFAVGAPQYVKDLIFFSAVCSALVVSLLGIVLGQITERLHKIQNQLIEMQKDINSPFGK